MTHAKKAKEANKGSLFGASVFYDAERLRLATMTPGDRVTEYRHRVTMQRRNRRVR